MYNEANTGCDLNIKPFVAKLLNVCNPHLLGFYFLTFPTKSQKTLYDQKYKHSSLPCPNPCHLFMTRKQH